MCFPRDNCIVGSWCAAWSVQERILTLLLLLFPFRYIQTLITGMRANQQKPDCFFCLWWNLFICVTAAGSFSPETSTVPVSIYQCRYTMGSYGSYMVGTEYFSLVRWAWLASPKCSGSCSACTLCYYLLAIWYYK